MIQNLIQNRWYAVATSVECGSCSQPNGVALLLQIFNWERLSSNTNFGTFPAPMTFGAESLSFRPVRETW